MSTRTVFANIQRDPNNDVNSNYTCEDNNHEYTTIKYFNSTNKQAQPLKRGRKKRLVIIGLVILTILIVIILAIAIVLIVLATTSNSSMNNLKFYRNQHGCGL